MPMSQLVRMAPRTRPGRRWSHPMKSSDRM
jgi:hypothetical protein